MDPSVLSGNLRRIRVAKGKTQTEVAEATGLSLLGYRKIEGGVSTPRVDSLLQIATALGVKLQRLLAPTRPLSAVRFRATKKMTTRGDILSDVARWLADYDELETLLGCHETFGLASVREAIATLPAGEARATEAARRARAAMGLTEDEPIRDICGLLERHGIKVFTPAVASDAFFGLSVAERDGGPAIVVNVWERLSVERWIFTAAHELGHLLMHLSAYDVSATDEDVSDEKEADTFASHFLMPEGVFAKELREARGLPLVRLVFKLKRIFHVSWKSVLYKIASRSPDGKRLWPQFHSEYRRMTGRSVGKADEPGGLGADSFRCVRPAPRAADEPEHLSRVDFVEDRLYRLVRSAVESEEISLGRAAEILRIDLTSMRELSNAWVN